MDKGVEVPDRKLPGAGKAKGGVEEEHGSRVQEKKKSNPALLVYMVETDGARPSRATRLSVTGRPAVRA